MAFRAKLPSETPTEAEPANRCGNSDGGGDIPMHSSETNEHPVTHFNLIHQHARFSLNMS